MSLISTVSWGSVENDISRPQTGAPWSPWCTAPLHLTPAPPWSEVCNKMNYIAGKCNNHTLAEIVCLWPGWSLTTIVVLFWLSWVLASLQLLTSLSSCFTIFDSGVSDVARTSLKSLWSFHQIFIIIYLSREIGLFWMLFLFCPFSTFGLLKLMDLVRVDLLWPGDACLINLLSLSEKVGFLFEFVGCLLGNMFRLHSTLIWRLNWFTYFTFLCICQDFISLMLEFIFIADSFIIFAFSSLINCV